MNELTDKQIEKLEVLAATFNKAQDLHKSFTIESAKWGLE